jgi:hypothetical protein
MGSVLFLKRHYGHFRISPDTLGLGSNPVEAAVELTLESVDDGRKVFCRRQTQCVTFAASQKWAGFRCDDCGVEENLTREEQQTDLDGLAGLLRTLNLPRLNKTEIDLDAPSQSLPVNKLWRAMEKRRRLRTL